MLAFSAFLCTILTSAILYFWARKVPTEFIYKRISEWKTTLKIRLLRTTNERRQIEAIILCIQQLVYLRDFPMNLHSKLQKCIPLSGCIRPYLVQLTMDWYMDPIRAIEQFRTQLNHNQADGFCDTLRALFEVGDEQFYEHLKSRMLDLKLLLRQRKEAQKETRSYMFFILAGIPLIHSFQIFLYPWLAESSNVIQTIH